MYFSVRLAGSENWCSKDPGWIIGALQKEHQRALDQRRLADYTCEGDEARLTVKVDFILPQGERKAVTTATLSVNNTPHTPPEAAIRYKGAHKNLKATPPDVNPEIKKVENLCFLLEGVRQAVEKFMKKGKVPAEASQVEQHDVIDLSLSGLDEDEGKEDKDITAEPAAADNVLKTPHQQRPVSTGSAQQQADPATCQSNTAKRGRGEKSAAAAAPNADPESEVQGAGTEGHKQEKKRRLVKGKELAGQARTTRARTVSQKVGAAAESSDAHDEGTDGEAHELPEMA
ncbi:g5312 [Coccomyxa elongata]